MQLPSIALTSDFAATSNGQVSLLVRERMNKNLENDRPDQLSGASEPEVGTTYIEALSTTACRVNEHCVGDRWTVGDSELLAKLIAIIAMGQAKHAARIITEFLPAEPLLKSDALREDAKQRLTVTGNTPMKRKARRWHRDGLVFEAISWIAARQSATASVLMKDPHMSATTQGLDGLMIELDEQGKTVVRATILEDKCSNSPRQKFRDEVLPTFLKYHAGKRATELVAAASSLLDGKIASESVTESAARVMDLECRAYRAGLTIAAEHDSDAGREALFKGYDDLERIAREQRIGATFLPPDELRSWFEDVADRAIALIDEIGEEED